jgi:hypothetical protein
MQIKHDVVSHGNFIVGQSQQMRFENFKTLRGQPITVDVMDRALKEEGGQNAFELLRQGVNQVLVGPYNIRDFNGCDDCYYFQETRAMV